MRSDGRLVKGIYGLQSSEWEEDQSLNFLNWDEMPEAGPHEEVMPTMCNCRMLWDRERGMHHVSEWSRRQGPVTEELKSMSADGRTTKEVHSRQRKTARRQEVCVADMQRPRGPENFRDAVTGQSLKVPLFREKACARILHKPYSWPELYYEI